MPSLHIPVRRAIVHAFVCTGRMVRLRRRTACFGPATLALAAVLLTGCGKSAKERAAEFGAKCGEAGFTPSQCAFLWAMARRAEGDAADANILAAVALSSSTATAAAARR